MDLREILGQALEGVDEPLIAGSVGTGVPREPFPRWPSGLFAIDELTGGGFYGYSAIAGAKKIGKSMLGLRSTCEAAQAGWDVVYFLGEGTEGMVERRLEQMYGSDHELWPSALENWDLRFFRSSAKLSFAGMVEYAQSRIGANAERVLIAIDSVNRLAKHLERPGFGQRYFDVLRQIGNFGQLATELSEGRIGFLTLSEVNRKGGAVGMDIEYACAVLVSIRRATTRGHVRIEVESRDTASGDLGVFRRAFSELRFKPKLHAVKSEKDPQEELGY